MAQRQRHQNCVVDCAVLPGQDDTGSASEGLHPRRPSATGERQQLSDGRPDQSSGAHYWQEGVAKLLKLGVAGFKMDRAEEDIPETGPYKVFDGRTIRENRNAYPAMYVKAVYEIAKKYRGDDVALMPRAAYTGSSPYVFWGGDIGGTQEGLRASIIAVQRSAVMGYQDYLRIYMFIVETSCKSCPND